MKSISVIYMASLVLVMFVVPAKGIEKDQQTEVKKVTENLGNKQEESCKNKSEECDNKIEKIEVRGYRITPFSGDSKGVYTLDREMLEEYSFGNGNLNDILGILPGVQFGEGAYAASQVSNIKPSEVSIAGTQGHQSGYQIDGVSNNSKLSVGNSERDENSPYNVAGHSQETFLNLNILDEIEVYDSNVPAKYGQFSGGLVLAKTKNAYDKTEFGISYRTTESDFVQYHKFYDPKFDGGDILDTAVFVKRDLSIHLSQPLTDSSGLVAQFQVLESEQSFDQVGAIREHIQTNYNGLLKYHSSITNEDELVFRFLYAPYTGNYFDTNAINSDYEVKGGGQSFLTSWKASRSWGDKETKFSWRKSENSKNTQSNRFIWANLPGKDWGSYYGSKSSSEGGYGDIEKTQETLTFAQDFELVVKQSSWGQHSVSFGYQYENQVSVFDRLEDTTIYNGAVISPDINCSGYVLDCVETTFKRPISEIEAELGRPLDLTIQSDFVIYSNNLESTGQYFQSRQVAPKARAEAKINYFSAYVEDVINWSDLELSMGLRYDVNDFFKNHSIAPRLRMKIDLFEKQQLILGANRYYESDLATYKLNQAMEPIHREVRKQLNERPLQWQASRVSKGYIYDYQETKTPYTDELTTAYRLPVFGGIAELKWVNRHNKKSINRIKGYNDLGESIMYAGNQGSSEYERWTLSWMAQFSNQHVEFNVSHASNKTSKKSFDGDTVVPSSSLSGETLNYSYNDDELVFLSKLKPDGKGNLRNNFYLVTRHDINLEKQDFNRPVVANLSWAGRWGNWSFSSYLRYNGKQDAIYATNQTETVKSASTICSGCEPTLAEYPVYRLNERPSFWLLSGSIQYQLKFKSGSQLSFNIDGENITNNRTYQITPFSTGLELGRRFWLGVSYDY